jgi:dipeptidyl aminopeptidase/acylaminoacyl peptidase
MRKLLIVGVVAAACGGPSKSPSPAPTPAPETARHDEAARPPPAAVDATPDVPAGADAARDAELAKLAASIIDTTLNSQPLLTRDGKRVVFVSNRDGLPQLYIADAGKPDAPATRLVTSTERVATPANAATLTPDGKSLVYRSDHGADENWQLFRLSLGGGEPVLLTPGDKRRRDEVIIADGKPDTLFYSASAMAEVGESVYATSLGAPGEEKLIYHDDKPGGLVDVSRDGKWGLYVRTPSRSENYLLAVDLATGTTRPVYPMEGTKAAIYGARFTPDGKRAIVTTDGGAEQALVLSINLATGKETARYVEARPATASIQALAVAKKGNALAVIIDAGNHREVRLLDAATLKPRAAVSLPLGTGTAGEFSSDGKRLTISWSSPSAPTDISAIEVATGKVVPLRKDNRPQLDAMPPIEASIAEVEAFDHLKIPVNVYLPSGVGGKKLPVIVSYHGGPAGSSAIGWNALARFFLGQGYAWVEPNVRGSTGFGRAYEMGDNGAKRLDAFKDIETAGRWAASQPWADKDRVVVFGGSYGGYTVLVALTRMPDLWRAGVNLFGVANLKTFMATTSGYIRELFLVEFGDPDKDAAFLDSISPALAADKIVDPLFVYAGANDPRVPRTESDLIVKAVRAHKVPIEYMVMDNEGHSLAHRESQIAFYSRAARFLEAHLK